MGASFIDPSSILALLLMILGAGVRDLASCLSTDYYWKAKSVTVSVEQLTRELQPADMTKLIADLDADDPKTRDEASLKIASIGQSAIPALEDAAKNGSPEVVARANALLGKIHAAPKAASVRRLMAIRTLGERKDAAALPTLRLLVVSKELFEADYAKSAIAKIEGKSYMTPVATDADRAADVALLPAKLDIVAQVAPENAGTLSIDSMIAPIRLDEQQKARSREEANSQILKLLEESGNIQLDSLTWGFYAAPPGQPGNTMGIGRGVFDPVALSAVLGKAIPNSKKVDDVEIFEVEKDSSIVLAPNGRVIFLSREPTGELGLDAMLAALKKGTGDFAADPDLPPMVKTLDTKAPFWAAAKIGIGMKEIVGPLTDFDSATLVATQSKDHAGNDLHLEAMTTDPAKAKQSVESMSAELKGFIAEAKEREQLLPFIKPFDDFVETIKLDANGGKATMDGKMPAAPMLPALMMLNGRIAAQAIPAPAPVPQPPIRRR